MEIKYSGLKTVVAGCGSIGRRHIEVLLNMGVDCITACDPDEKTLENIKKDFPAVETIKDYSEALKEKPFAVFVLTPTKMHIPMAIEALKAGAHVFVEKPLSNSSQGLEELKRTSVECNRRVMVGFCFRYHKALLYAKKLLDDGEIGRAVSIRALMGEDFPAIHPEYKDMYLSKYSGAFELVHDIDLAIWLAGSEVEDVYGIYGSFSDYEFESPDTVEMLMKFKGKCTASVHLDFFQSPRRRVMEVIGTKGVITVDFASWDDAYVSVYKKSSGEWTKLHIPTRRNDMFEDENREFFNRAINNEEMICSIDEAAKSLKAVEKIYAPY